MPVFVDGYQLIAPQAVAVVKEESVVSNQPATPLIVALIGLSDGGKPGEFTPLYNFTQARSVFRSGQLVDLLRRIYGPAQGAPGAYKCLAYRVNAGAQATGALKDGSAANVITLATRDYGLHTNQVRLKVEAGGTSGYKVSVQGFSGTGTLARDNLARAMMQIQYTGAGSAATLAISATTLTTVVTGGAAGESVALTFANYPTIQNLADALVGTGGFAVTVKADGRLLGATMDALAATDCKTAAVTLSANTQAVIDWLNNEEPYIVATRVNGNALAAMATYASLTGGSNGASVTSTDYQTALTALQAETCNIVLVGTDDATVHVMADAHAQLMSQIGANKERITIVGGALSESVAQAQARAVALNSYRTALAYPGMKDTDDLGADVTLAPYHVAAAIAGVLAGASVGQPATRKPVRCIGPEKRLTPSEIDGLLLAGVMPIQAHPDEGARIVQSILTYNPTQTGAPNLLRREISSRLAADVLVDRVRSRLDNNLIGQSGGPLLREQAKSIAESELKAAENDGLIVGDQAHPAWSELSATVANDAITVSFRAAVVTPGNYVVLRASLGTFSGM